MGWRFLDRRHLVQALTHGSARSGNCPSNQRLEFLGDAILGMVVSLLIFADDPEREEGPMTKAKAQAVSRRSLGIVAAAIGVEDCLIVGKSFENPEEKRGSMIADAVEALIAAVFLDGGFHAAFQFVERHFRPLVDEASVAPGEQDSKSRLGQWTQHRGLGLPQYRVVSIEGPDHALVFEVEVLVGGERRASGKGGSKKAAEKLAASRALEVLEET